MRNKVDNGNVQSKLDLRRYFLRKYHADGSARVFDCCQGSDVIWSTLRREFDVASYWGVDLKPKPGRLMIDSVRVLSQSGWRENVIDVDTYGSPWKHWAAMLPNVTRPTTVFLTSGAGVGAMSTVDSYALEAMGISARILKVLPTGLRRASIFRDMVTPYVMSAVPPSVRVVEAVEAEPSGFTSYLGVRLEPDKSSAS